MPVNQYQYKAYYWIGCYLLTRDTIKHIFIPMHTYTRSIISTPSPIVPFERTRISNSLKYSTLLPASQVGVCFMRKPEYTSALLNSDLSLLTLFSTILPEFVVYYREWEREEENKKRRSLSHNPIKITSKSGLEKTSILSAEFRQVGHTHTYVICVVCVSIRDAKVETIVHFLVQFGHGK